MEKWTDTRFFKSYRMDLDTSEQLLAPNVVRETYNMVEELSSGRIVNLKGFSQVPGSTGDYKCIGTAENVEDSTIIYFLYAYDDDHAIMEYSTETGAISWILKDEPILNFKEDCYISADVIQGLLYWTDGYFGSYLNNDFNPPRKINIAKAKAYTLARPGAWDFANVGEAGDVTQDPQYEGLTAYWTSGNGSSFTVGSPVVAWVMGGSCPEYRHKEYSGYGTVLASWYGGNLVVTTRPWQGDLGASEARSGYILPYVPNQYFGIDWQVMDRIKWPPAYAPTAGYDNDYSKNQNALRNNLFQFCYRWVYDDNEKSVWSPFSEIPIPTTIETLNGTFTCPLTIDNVINVWYDTGSMEVKIVEIAVRKGNDGNWIIVNRSYKYTESGDIILPNDVFHSYQFLNTNVGEAVDQIDVNRPYDAVPQISKNNRIIEKNRLLDADYVEGFSNIDIDVSMSPIKEFLPYFNSQTNNGGWSSFGYPVPNSDEGFTYTLWKSTVLNFFEPGFVYFIYVDGSPNKYDDSAPNSDYWFDFLNYYMRAWAIVNADDSMTLQSFCDKVCEQLRYGTSDGRVIAINDYNYKGVGDFAELRPAPDSLTDIMLPGELGFICYQHINGQGDMVWNSMNIFISKSASPLKYKTYKSSVIQRLGIEYLDRSSRRSMVLENEDTNILIPSFAESGNDYPINRTDIGWMIKNDPPDWAEYYRIVRARTQTDGYFLQCTMSYIGYAAPADCIVLNINSYIILQSKITPKFTVETYTWQKGDRVRFLLNREDGGAWKVIGSVLDFEILGIYTPDNEDIYKYDTKGEAILDSDGNKIVNEKFRSIMITSFDYSAYGIRSDNTTVEIYRPLKTDDPNVFYCHSKTYKIINPHTPLRYHEGYDDSHPGCGVLTCGDSYIYPRLIRNTFPCESNSYSDFYKSNSIDIGKINAELRDARRTEYVSNFLFSGKLIQNTLVNDLSRVDSSDSVTLPDKYGPIASMEEVGFTLKILQKSKPSSLYIGRAGVTQPSSESKEILSSTKDVLGTLIVHDSDYGTVHPQSVVKYNGRMCFFDFYAQAICRDVGNGIENLTETYGLSNSFREKCELFSSASNVDVFSAWDSEYNMVLFTFIDKTTYANSFTIGFRDKGGKEGDGFCGFYQFTPGFYGYAKKVLTSYSGGSLWRHNSANVARCNFYGTQYKYWVTVVTNKVPTAVKRFFRVMISSAYAMFAPNPGDVAIEESGNNPTGQMSMLPEGQFTSVQGKWVAELGRNMEDDSDYGGLVDGDDLQGQSMSIRLEGDQTVEHKVLTVEFEGVS